MSPPSTKSSSSLSSMLSLLLTHPCELPILLKFYLYHKQKRDITARSEHPTSGWDRASMRRCWEFLDDSGRSFAAVIKGLDGDLARTICLFYLVLRGLDTIEDDMTLPDDVKQSMLRSFHIKTVTPGWNFEGSGPDEKDRQVLVEYATIIEELNLLPAEYLEVILDITQKMANGMADYAHKASSTGSIYIETVSEYDLYCHYVAGLVGEGLCRIFAATKKEDPSLGTQLELSNSMGLLLQKTNIIRDYREDTDERRFFWPREIWGKYGFKEMKEFYEEGNEERARWVLSAMIVDGLRHATDALDFLRLLRNGSVFGFCAIPATMAVASLSLCFGNGDVFRRSVKIRKAEAASLMMRSTNVRDVAYIFRDYCRRIHARAHPSDPNFLGISAACGKVEVWCEQAYPSFIQLSYKSEEGTRILNHKDPRSRILQADMAYDEQLRERRRVFEFQKTPSGTHPENGPMVPIVATVLVLVLGFVMWVDGALIVPERARTGVMEFLGLVRS